VGDLSSVVAPPWDVISETRRAELRSLSPYNVVNLTLPDPGDGGDGFESSARLLRRWQEEGVLTRDELPAMYLYRHAFEWEGVRHERTGLIVSLELREGDVRGHEETRINSREDRCRLLEATGCVFGPIFMLCPDPEAEFRELLREASGEESTIELGGERHTFCAIEDPDFQERARRALEARTLVIADGHHRYWASVENLRLSLESGRESEWVRHTMAFCVSVKDPGLFVLPSHRMLEGLAKPASHYLEAMHEVARVEAAEGLDQLRRRMADGTDVRMGLVVGEGKSFHLVTVDREAEGSGVEYDVEYLHDRILGPVLGDEVSRIGIDYTQTAAEAVERVLSGERDMCFLLRGVHPQDVVVTAERGQFMPSKSTYFHPKPLTGLVLMGGG
jgi:uncharacterized protein (DUF1015 family)